jgi:hypothetical protein
MRYSPPRRSENRAKDTHQGRRVPAAAAFLIALLAAISFSGCGRAGDGARRTVAPSPAAAASPKPMTPFERDLEYVRKGQFDHIYVLSRKDGAPLDSKDKAYIKEKAPMVTNMWVVTDDNRYAIAGVNAEFAPQQIEALRERFNFEDYTNR